MGRSGLVVMVAVLIALFLFARHSAPPANANGPNPVFGGSGSVSAHLSVVPTIRSVTVSPGSVNFGSCTGGLGQHNLDEQLDGIPERDLLGGYHRTGRALPHYGHLYRPSRQRLGQRLQRGPLGQRHDWSLCNPVGQPACTGGQGKPGKDQFAISTFAPQVANFAVLTGNASCDNEFNPGGGCSAAPAQSQSQTQHEGIQLTGPTTWDDGSTSWNVSITWIAASTG